MTLNDPRWQAVKDKYEVYKLEHPESYKLTKTVDTAHKPWKEAYFFAGQSIMGAELFFTVFYCSECLLGFVQKASPYYGDIPHVTDANVEVRLGGSRAFPPICPAKRYAAGKSELLETKQLEGKL